MSRYQAANRLPLQVFLIFFEPDRMGSGASLAGGLSNGATMRHIAPSLEAANSAWVKRHQFLFRAPQNLYLYAHRLVSASMTQRKPSVPALSLLGAISRSFPC
jgi:hypothetical protein